MSVFVKYTCNKKNIPIMRKDCETCSEYNPCAKDGKWCFAGALLEEHDPVCSELTMPSMESAAAPVLRDTYTVKIYLGDGTTVDVLRENIKKQIESELYKSIGFMFGA